MRKLIFSSMIICVLVSIMSLPILAYLRQEPDGTDIVGLWHLNDNNDPESDSSGNSYNGILFNTPVFVTGCQFGGCYDFEMADVDYIYNAFVPFSATFTITAWATVESLVSEDYHSIVSRGGVFQDDTNYAMGLRNSTGSNYRIFCYFRNGSTLGGLESDYTTTFSDIQAWVFYACTYDSATNNIAIYANGESIGTDTESVDPTDGSQLFIIGRPTGHTSTDEYWDGKIDEVVIYNRALSADEIADLYNAQRFYYGPTVPDGIDDPEILYHFDGDALDSSGNGNDGTPSLTAYTSDAMWGQGIQFDEDTNDYVTVPYANIEGFNSGTVEFWFKANPLTIVFLRVLTLSDGSASDDITAIYIGAMNATYADETIQFYNEQGGVQELIFVTREGNDFLFDGLWHYVAIVVGNEYNWICVDGRFPTITFDVGSSSTASFSDINTPSHSYIGRLQYNSTGYYNMDGILDEIAIYPGVTFTKEEILQRYQDQKGNYGEVKPDLANTRQAVWRMEASSGDEPDRSGNANDCTDNATVTVT